MRPVRHGTRRKQARRAEPPRPKRDRGGGALTARLRRAWHSLTGRASGGARRHAPNRARDRASVRARVGAAASALGTAGGEAHRLLRGAVDEIGRTILAVSETLGRLELQIARILRRPLLALVQGTRATVRAGERVVTPRRAVAVVVLCAAVLLGVSQFVDYRGIGIGAPQYRGVEAVAPAPQTDREPAGSAHGYALLGVAVLTIGALAFTLRGRWRLGRVVSLLGAAGVAVSLLIDIPKGLDEGTAALAFEDARAELIEGFWVQLAASAVLLVTGVLLGRYARAERQPAGRPARRAKPARRRRRGRSARTAEAGA
jgi:hypothetical protein